MEKITLEQIAVAITFLVGFVGGIGFLNRNIKSWFTKFVEEQFSPFQKKINEMNDNIKKVDTESCKNYLVRCLGDFEQGCEMSDVEQERFWEQYEHYLKSGGNSYIKHRVEKLQSEGKL